MIRRFISILGCVALLSTLPLLSGCGSGNKEGGAQAGTVDVNNADKLGNANCLQCHNAGKDLTMINDLDTRTIGGVYQDSVHFNPLFNPNANGEVQCEDCHGGGQFHWGTGPLAHPVPDWTVCVQCHKPPFGDFPTEFPLTAHANVNQVPDKFFFQGGTGTSQAENRGVPEVTPSGDPVSKNQHIEECSMCHDSNQRFVYDTAGNLLKPDPADMPNPTVSCANCHDAHQVGKIVMVATRPAGPNPQGNLAYPISRKVQVDANGANDLIAGTWIRPLIYQPNGAVQPDGTVDMSKVAGTNNELSVEKLCASCHTKGKYKYSRQSTHQTDTYSQWRNSGHAERTAPPFGEFAANPLAYDPTFQSGVGSHQSLWPFDMRCGSSIGGAGNAAALSAPPTSPDPSTCTNAAVSNGRGGFNDNFPCYRCHNGMTSISYQEDTQGTSAAPVVFGDEPVMCITCHDPHATSPNLEFNLRRPKIMTKYTSSSVNLTFSGNVFLDTQPVPDAALNDNGVICLFCHQGRESGYTLYWTKLAPGTTITGNFFNPHYLGTAAMLWGANAYEYAGALYGFNTAHQGAMCPTCHMDNATSNNQYAGHTWKPNVETCNDAACHGAPGFGMVPRVAGTKTPDVARYRADFDTTNYTGDPNGSTQSIARTIRSLQDKVLAILAAQGVYYDDTVYPYFFNVPLTSPNGTPNNHSNSNAYTAWTPAQYKAAFNISYTIKGLPSAGPSANNTYVLNGAGLRVPDTSATLLPNNSAAVHDFRYIIELLLDSYKDLTGSLPAGATRPAGTRPATVYGPGQ